MLAAVGLVAAFFLPWMQANANWAADIASVNAKTGVDLPSSWPWVFFVTNDGSVLMHDVASELVTFGAIAAVIFALVILVYPGRVLGLSVLAFISFVAAAIGAIWQTAQFNQMIQTVDFQGHDLVPGMGLWVFAAAAGIGAIAVIGDIALPDAVAKTPQSLASNQPDSSVDPLASLSSSPPSASRKQCPDCAEEVLAAAKICRFCRHQFDAG